MGPIDFELPDDKGGTVAFDAQRRGQKHPLLFFYRGYW